MMTRRKRRNGNGALAYHERNLRTSILSLLRAEGGMPRVVMCEKLNLTAAMVTRCVQRLREDGLVCLEGRSKGAGGRLCNNVALNPKAGVVIGLEYRKEAIVAVAVDFSGRREKDWTFSLPASARNGDPPELLAALTDTVAKTVSEMGRSRRLLGVAAVDPGIVDSASGIALFANAFPKWRDVLVRDHLAQAFSVPVSLSNSSNAILEAVDRMEMRRKYADMLYLEFRDGISCAIKSNGRQVLGSRGMAGEMTHMAVGREGQAKGHVYLEEVAGVPSILRAIRAAGYSGISEDAGQRRMLDEVLTLARGGHSIVAPVVRRAWRTLGVTLGNLVNVLNPSIVVLDSYLAQAGDEMLDELRKGMAAQMLPSHAHDLRVVVSRLEAPVAPVGAALGLLDDLTFSGAVVGT